ncbi:MAG: 5-(carboxyamino)imidazole ribonucleotide mutase [Deltaproteobacteria bacterium]|nr:5-(carboxyamino)imidazole ribonucleotide mutase [Deltaproteobacteria bacterium]OQX63774.1 MAG: 5-(carboxyamino)imidazole ribonucleotide mutase [Desulfococcus sp. 4484_242]
MSENRPRVAVIMGSASDSEVMKGCVQLLKDLGVSHEVRVLSAHRTPEMTRDYACSAADRGIEVIIAAAGWAAHLAGAVAANTTLPVIGVPIDSSPFKGLDALLSTVQMPSGIPVATVAVGSGGAKNAALLAGQILALKHPDIAKKVKEHRRKLSEEASKNVNLWDGK